METNEGFQYVNGKTFAKNAKKKELLVCDFSIEVYGHFTSLNNNVIYGLSCQRMTMDGTQLTFFIPISKSWLLNYKTLKGPFYDAIVEAGAYLKEGKE